MLLHAERDGDGPPLVLVHGFTQTGRCWGPVAGDLAQDHEVVRVDAPGHGGSSEVMAGLRTGGRLILDQGGRAAYLGYSMGARFCLHLALSNPELVRCLVLVSGTAGIEDPQERADRRRRDLETAALVRSLGVQEFVRRWVEQPMFAGIPPERACTEERRANTVEGLTSSLEQAGTGVQDPRWRDLPRLGMPVLVVAGERDERYVAIAERMASSIGSNATLAVVPGTGHAAHLEDPDAFLTAVRPWLATHAR